MELHVFIPVLFLFLFLITAVVMPFFGWISLDIFKPYYLLMFVLMLIAGLIWNVFYYKGAQDEKVQEFELIIMLQPLLTILLAAILIERQTNWHILVASIIASSALIVSHIKKDHFVISRAGKGLIVAVVFMSVEIILQKIILEVLSPAALYFIRTGIMFIFFLYYYRPSLKQVGNINALFILLSAFLGVVQMITKFYGFQDYGVIYTSLVLTLAPILVYIISAIGLHEKLKIRTIISALIILACVIYAAVFGK